MKISIKRFQQIAQVLLKSHYGLDLNDTHLCEEEVVKGCIEQGCRPYQVVAEHAAEADLDRVDQDWLGCKTPLNERDENAVIQSLPDDGVTNQVVANTVILDDRYGDTIIGDQPDKFDAIEIQGVREHHGPDGSFCEVDFDNPEFFSVYVHLIEGGVDCVGDFSTHSLAGGYAKELAEKYHWPINDFSPKQSQAV